MLPPAAPPGLPRLAPLSPHAAPQTLLCASSSPRRLQPPGPGWHRGVRQPACSRLHRAASCCGYESEGVGCGGCRGPQGGGAQGSGPCPATYFCPQAPPTSISPQTRRKRCFQALRQVPASPQPLIGIRGWAGGVGACPAHAPDLRWPPKGKAYVSGPSSRPSGAKPMPTVPRTGPQNNTQVPDSQMGPPKRDLCPHSSDGPPGQVSIPCPTDGPPGFGLCPSPALLAPGGSQNASQGCPSLACRFPDGPLRVLL